MARIAPSWLTQGTRKLVLLPPKGTTVPDVFRCLAYDPHLYNQLLENMQRLRGRVLLQIATGERRPCVVPSGSYVAMPKIVWMNWRCATGSPLATQRI